MFEEYQGYVYGDKLKEGLLNVDKLQAKRWQFIEANNAIISLTRQHFLFEVERKKDKNSHKERLDLTIKLFTGAEIDKLFEEHRSQIEKLLDVITKSNEESEGISEVSENAVENENLQAETEVHSGVSGQSDDEAKIEDVEPIEYQGAVVENPESESEKSEDTAEVHNDADGQADNKVEPFKRGRRQRGLGSVYPIINSAKWGICVILNNATKEQKKQFSNKLRYLKTFDTYELACEGVRSAIENIDELLKEKLNKLGWVEKEVEASTEMIEEVKGDEVAKNITSEEAEQVAQWQ